MVTVVRAHMSRRLSRGMFSAHQGLGVPATSSADSAGGAGGSALAAAGGGATAPSERLIP